MHFQYISQSLIALSIKWRRPAADTSASQSSPEVPPRPTDSSSPVAFYGLFDSKGKPVDQHEEQKIQSLRKRVMDKKGAVMKDAQILWTLHSNFSRGNEDKAFNLLMAISDASDFLVKDYNPAEKLLGAENRQGVTCYLDSILFGMFSRLESFEAMLYNSFEDLPRSKLGLLLRLWVNLLRTGQLITTDITKLIQQALAECGWEEAAKLCQQDASEAFTFITEKLELPLLTLKMDIYHTGKEDENDDHKFINERLLEVAIPHELSNEKQIITLEDCLEEYFNNRIEVRRYLERRSTINSMRSFDSSKKNSGIHVETVELDSDSSPTTPLSSSPSYASRPSTRQRTPSIIQERYIPDRDESGFSSLVNVDSKTPTSRLRRGSMRKEVMMPAWQFFSLIPWYTDHAPSSDAQVANHFSAKRPVLGLCLKRYSITATGRAIRLNTQIDIPIEIGLPHFIQDDHMDDEGPLYGNFKLSLQSVVCHRGSSVDSGHYIALTRSTNIQKSAIVRSSGDSLHWLRFDDLAPQRITLIDIEKALKEETPYLLFYQIVPIDGDPGHIVDGEQPPVYTGSRDSAFVEEGSMMSLTLRPSREEQLAATQPSIEITGAEEPRGRSPDETRRASIAFSEPLSGSTQLGGFVGESNTSRPSTRGGSPAGRKSQSLSRTSTRPGEGLTKTLSRLAGVKGKEAPQVETVSGSEIQVREVSNSVSTMDDPRPIVDTTKATTQKPQKREKSRSRLSKHGAGKARENKPDRECIVM